MDELTDPAYVKEENERVLTMVTALYVKSLYPDLSVPEIFERLQDIEFVKEIINRVISDLNKALGDSEHGHDHIS